MANQRYGLDVEFLAFFLKDFVDTLFKFLHYQEGIRCQCFERIYEGKLASIHELGKYFKLFFHENSFLSYQNGTLLVVF